MLQQPYFGQRLRALRRERNLSQAALAGEEMSTGYLSRLESGARPPTRRVIKYLAERLDVPVRSLEVGPERSLAQVLAAASSAGDGDVSEELLEALRTDHEPLPELHWQALWLLAKSHGARGEHDQEHQLLIDLSKLADDLAVPALQCRTNTQLSRCVRLLGDNTMAREYALRAVNLSAGLGLSDRTAALHALISAEAEAGRLLEARTRADELVALTEPDGGAAFTRALWASATVSMRQGEHIKARTALESALAGLSSQDDLALWMRLRLAAVSLYLQLVPPETAAARARLAEVERVVGLIGTERNRQELLWLQAHLAFREDRPADARAYCDMIEQDGMQLAFRDRIRLRALRVMLRILDGGGNDGVAELRRLAQESYGAQNVELAAEIWRNLAEVLARLHAATSDHDATGGRDATGDHKATGEPSGTG